MNKKENYITFTFTECFSFIINIVLLFFVYTQHREIDNQNLMLNELSLKLAELQNNLNNLEQKLVLHKKDVVLSEKIVEEKTEFLINSGLYR